MPRFVILEHDHPHLHWDLMLEHGPVLRTWRLAEPPSAQAEIAAQPLGDHRAFYLDYEGPVSGDRGQVVRWDAGDYELIEDSASGVVIDFHGGRVQGLWTIQQDGADCLLARVPNG